MNNNRFNLTVIQFVLYCIIGYVMYEYLTWGKMLLFFAILLGIQTITRIKAVTDGMDVARVMMYVKENMNENDVDKIDDVFKEMKDTISGSDKKNWN